MLSKPGHENYLCFKYSVTKKHMIKNSWSLEKGNCAEVKFEGAILTSSLKGMADTPHNGVVLRGDSELKESSMDFTNFDLIFDGYCDAIAHSRPLFASFCVSSFDNCRLLCFHSC